MLLAFFLFVVVWHNIQYVIIFKFSLIIIDMAHDLNMRHNKIKT